MGGAILINEMHPESGSRRRVLPRMTKKNIKTKFKALMIDCDGTLIESRIDAVPSKKVTEAINKASKYIHIGLATSRSYEETEYIAKHLNLTGPSILNGGALIIDFKSDKNLWEKAIPKKTADKVAKVFKKYFSQTHLNDPVNYINFLENKTSQPVYNTFCPAQTEEVARKILKELSTIPDISSVYVPSWTDGKFDILAYHTQATKLHGIFEVAKILNLETKDFIVIGDGYNDFPLLEAAGLKVAMGNAGEELKAIADYVAPSVYNDGVADVIDKFILNVIPSENEESLG